MAPALGLDPDDAGLLSRLPRAAWARNGVPDDDDVAPRERATELVREALRPFLHPDGLRFSPLGAGWSGDLDAYLLTRPDPAALDSRGWLRLDPLLRRLGDADGGPARWAVVEGGRLLARLELIPAAPPPGPPPLARARRRGEVRLREVLELRALARRDDPLPAEDAALSVAADAEALLGGGLLARWRSGSAPTLPAPLPGRRAAARRLRRAWRAIRGPRVVVAMSGVDGSGKSGLARSLVADLRRGGVPAEVVWARPAARNRALHRAAQIGRYVLRQRGANGIERIARGETVADLPSRRGPVGVLWALLVTASYVASAQRAYRRAHGVVVWDRHVLDALVTLDLLYPGVDLRLPHALIRRLVPAADVTIVLDVPAAVAAARKEGSDAFSTIPSVRRQVECYETHLRSGAHRGRLGTLVSLDATRPRGDLAADALAAALRSGER